MLLQKQKLTITIVFATIQFDEIFNIFQPHLNFVKQWKQENFETFWNAKQSDHFWTCEIAEYFMQEKKWEKTLLPKVIVAGNLAPNFQLFKCGCWWKNIIYTCLMVSSKPKNKDPETEPITIKIIMSTFALHCLRLIRKIQWITGRFFLWFS